MGRTRRLRAFIEFAYRDKPWLLATSVVVAAVSFLAHFVVSVPGASVDYDALTVNLLAQHAELEGAMKITQRARDAALAYYGAIDRFNKDIVDAADSQHLTIAWFDESFRQLDEVRNNVNVTAGMFQGTHLSAAAGLEDHRLEVITNLERMDSTLRLIEEYYVNLRTCGAQLEEAQKRLANDGKQSEAIGHRRLTAFDGWDAAVSAFKRRHEIESDKRMVMRQQYHGKAILGVFALIAITTYVAVAFRVVMRAKPAPRR